MLYSLSINIKRPDSERKNAICKAPADVLKTLSELGFRNIILTWDKFSIRPLDVIFRVWQCHKVARLVNKGDTIILQGVTPMVLKLVDRCRHKGAKVVYLVHDLNYIRYKRESIELEACKHMDEIIVHTDEMRERLVSDGVKVSMKVMHLFDYRSDEPMLNVSEVIENKHIIAFAGNIDKSDFLYESKDIAGFSGKYQLHIYGSMPQPMKAIPHDWIEYKGCFTPEQTSFLKAGWGLVWDGYTMDSCKGNLGEYLKINSSHKISLYLACGIPVFVWSQSPIGQWLVKQGVAIAIDRLADIPAIIDKITDDKYSQLISNAQSIGKKLRNGIMLKQMVEYYR